MAAGAGADTGTKNIVIIMRGSVVTYGVKWFTREDIAIMYGEVREIDSDVYMRMPKATFEKLVKLKPVSSKPWHQSRAQQWKNNRRRAR